MKVKFPYSVRKSLVKILPLSLLMGMAVACSKEKEPEPWREAVIPWMWGAGDGIAPPMDTVTFYANDPTIKYIYIHLMQVNTYGTTWEPIDFNRAHDSLQRRININPDKVRGKGVIKVGKDGAHIHPDTLTKKYGMWEPDSLWYTKNGWRVQRYHPISR